ncbi:galactose-specific lectin nattectin-like protein [Lates japonicus]|uniref:Galactose-specific lectin nattectin-like protein n=1 Tax=Lates japonicus TaxID=270547 RepID=A0AAD3RJN2_LATJO|nr:galactose-specific lectin nattectin-like protein [Lates japonicus]GLD70967.1 galactose-specific lectin nattectin-like protein [Lates japonicus]
MGDAENICLSLGGNLASVHSAAENRLLRELIRKGSGSYVHTWIGGYDGIKEGQWMWTDGSNFDYQIWGPGEPNNHGGAENCIEMNWAVEYWNDLPCFYGKPFVCAKDL